MRTRRPLQSARAGSRYHPTPGVVRGAGMNRLMASAAGVWGGWRSRAEVERLRAAVAEAADALHQAERERDAVRRAYGEACRDRDGYRTAYDLTCGERDGYKRAYDGTCLQVNRYRQFLADSTRRRPCPPQFLFLHLAKTAGHAVLSDLGRRFDPARALAVGTPAQLDAHTPGELEQYDFVYGHFGWRNLAALRPDRVACTFLREPVDRVVSLYWYYRCEDGLIGEHVPAGELPEEVARARRMDLIDYVRDDHPAVRRRVRDYQTHALADDWDADRPADGEALARAVANLRALDFVGVTERLDGGLAALAGRMGWEPPAGPRGRVNATPRRPRVADLTAAERAAVEEVTRLDAELYREAVRLAPG